MNKWIPLLHIFHQRVIFTQIQLRVWSSVCLCLVISWPCLILSWSLFDPQSSLCSEDRSSVYSSNYDIVDSMALMSDTRFDTIKHAPKNFIKIDDETFMYKPEKEISLPESAGTGISLQEQSLDQLTISLQGTNLFSGYVTIPRSKVSDSIHNLSKSQESFRSTIKSAKSRNLENVGAKCQDLKYSLDYSLCKNIPKNKFKWKYT